MSEKKIILIVDDEPDIVNLSKKVLISEDFDIITCSSGKMTLNIIAEKYNLVALIILDIMMPGESGYDILNKIKRNDKYKHILVCLFTIKDLLEDIQKGKTLGADGYLKKPFSGKELLKFVKEMLRKERSRTSSLS